MRKIFLFSVISLLLSFSGYAQEKFVPMGEKVCTWIEGVPRGTIEIKIVRVNTGQSCTAYSNTTYPAPQNYYYFPLNFPWTSVGENETFKVTVTVYPSGLGKTIGHASCYPGVTNLKVTNNSVEGQVTGNTLSDMTKIGIPFFYIYP